MLELAKIIQFKECLLPLYAHMIQVVLDAGFNYDTAKFCMQWGKNFPASENEGILFYGRANNGWITSSNDVNELFTEGSEDCIFALGNQMSWMEDDYIENDNGGGYRPSRSAFIRTMRNVASEYYDEWSSHVAWSNLYKIAPWKGGNPSDSLCYTELDDCVKIMQAEISFLSPCSVVMLTGWNWAKDFLIPMNGGQEPEYIDKEAWGDYWAWAYRIGGRLIIVSEHPQGKPEAAHAEAIVNLIERNSNN